LSKDYSCEDGRFPGVRQLRDIFKTQVCFPAMKQELILELAAEENIYLNALDVIKPLVVSTSQRSEELRLYDTL
jgi:hypothetical protein